MFGSVVIEIAIGLVFVYLLLSFVVTATQELIDAVFKIRAIHLARGIHKLLGTTQAQAFFNHALIKALSPTNVFRNGTRKPSYIPARTFVTTVIDMIAGGAAPRTPAIIGTGINNIADVNLKQSLMALWAESQNDPIKLEAVLEGWFNDQMDRVGGWYKRKAQLITILAAGLITLAMNADTLMIVRFLSSNSTLRASLVAQAQETSKQGSTPSNPNVENAGTNKDDVKQKQHRESRDSGISDRFTAVESSIKNVEGLGLPIRFGWWQKLKPNVDCPKGSKNCSPDELKYCPTLDSKDCSDFYFVEAIPGWILTMLAISLGAPFWFDMLNKTISIRSAGKAPDEKKK